MTAGLRKTAVERRTAALVERMAEALVEALWFVEQCEERHIGQAGTTAAAIRSALKAKQRMVDGAGVTGPPAETRPLLILTVGLPRSGKTTWALQRWHGTGTPIVSPDAIRLALHGQRFQVLAEPFVWAIAKVMVRALFTAGHPTVIVDATNTTRKRRDEWRDSGWTVAFHELDTSADECIRRARAMNDEMIVTVIERMAEEREPVANEERA